MEEARFNECMRRMRTGDKTALHEIYEAYIGYIYPIILNQVRNPQDAEDVTSEFFIKLWRLADTYKEGNGHKAWLAAIARNMAVDLLRKNRREILTDDFAAAALEPSARENTEEQVLSDMSLKEALQKLKPEEREIVHLKIMGEITFREIADMLKLPMGTVTWRYQSAIKKLRRYGYE